MSLVNITNVVVENNPAPFLSPFKFRITFECMKEIPDEIQWKLIYIGSAKDQKNDQIIDLFSMGPLAAGAMQFQIQSQPPNHNLIPADQLLDVTAIIISVSYRNHEFFRVGYYIHNSYMDEQLKLNPPPQIDITKIYRMILADKPRITRPNIQWSDYQQLQKHIQGVLPNNLQIEDPFLKSNGAFQQLDKIVVQQPSYSYGMFGNSLNQNIINEFQKNI